MTLITTCFYLVALETILIKLWNHIQVINTSSIVSSVTQRVRYLLRNLRSRFHFLFEASHTDRFYQD